MVGYDYRCPEHGVFTVYLPMGEAPEVFPCPLDENCPGALITACKRVYTVPALIMGHGFRKPWADKDQGSSKELQEHFGGRESP